MAIKDTSLAAPDVKAANARGQALLAGTPTAVTARYDRRVGRVVMALSTGLEIGFKPHDAQGLEAARPAQLADIEISPSGLGLYFPQLDADLYLPALLQGFLGSHQWMAQAMGKVGGRAVSPEKADAARANGRLGGRPRCRIPNGHNASYETDAGGFCTSPSSLA